MDTAIDSDAPDSADMRRLAEGHDSALNRLMERHATPLFHFLCRTLGNEDDANDVAQETFVRVFRHRADFRLGERFKPWLYTIAANLARNQFRHRARHPNVSLDAEEPATGQSFAEILPSEADTPGQQAERAERAAAVRVAVDRLPEELRAAIVLCEWEDFTVAEAAKILDATPKAVESRLYRARQLLREKLKPWV